MSDFPRDSFVVVKTMAEAMERIQDPILKGKYAVALIKYGIYGDYDHDNDYIDALMTQDEKLISSMAAKYDKAKAAGKLGGRKEKVSAEEVYQYVVVEGHDKKEAASHFNVDPRTIYRKIEKYVADRHFDEESGSWMF